MRWQLVSSLGFLAAGAASAAVVGQQDRRATAVTTSPGPTTGNAAPTKTQSGDAPAFTYDRHSFLLHGEPYVIVGGQMDPQRIPRAYWRDRLRKARAMGLNTIFSYVFWNLLEPEEGSWLGGGDGDDDNNDIAAYFRAAQDEGLHVVLRPGPYICGEREWGGFPYWLANVDGMRVRSREEGFMAAATRYLQRLAADLADLQVTRGGPLLMVQVENEYGSYGDDHVYTAAMRDVLRRLFEVPLYTNDGGVDWTLEGGAVPGVLAAIDGDPVSGFAARDRYITAPSMLGPLLDGEYYSTWADFWDADGKHQSAVGDAEKTAKLVADLDFVLSANNSISLYMFHGGTNFGFGNGAIWQAPGYSAIFTTSYDYGAPLDESGRTTALYDAFRDAITKYPHIADPATIPEPPPNLPLLEVDAFTLEPALPLFSPEVLGEPHYSDSSPPTMEALGQAYGFVLYEHKVTASSLSSAPNGSLSGTVKPGDRARDRVLVYVNSERVGVIDSTYERPAEVHVALREGDVLRLLVENLGRVDYWSRESGTPVSLEDQRKGIAGDVSIADAVLEGWDAYSLPLSKLPTLERSTDGPGPASPPFFYRGTFEIPADMNDPLIDRDPATLDTFLTILDGVKSVVWVNGFNLGRYWVVGPQQSLYLPGSVLKGPGEGSNEVVVLELEPVATSDKNDTGMVAFGSAERTWGNNPDPDNPAV